MLLVDCGLDTSYLSAPRYYRFKSTTQNMYNFCWSLIRSFRLYFTSFSDAITSNVPSENKEYDKKRRKLARRGQFLAETPEFSSINWNIHIYFQLLFVWAHRWRATGEPLNFFYPNIWGFLLLNIRTSKEDYAREPCLNGKIIYPILSNC